MSQEIRPKLLVIEDDEDLASVIGNYFKSAGYHVELRQDALGPLSRFRKSAGGTSPWDLILTDLKIPGMDGIEFIREMKALAPLIPVVLMTAHGSIETAVKAVRDGAYDFVLKPLKFPELSVTLTRALEHRKLREDNLSLRAIIQESGSPSGIISKSPAMKAVCDLVARVAGSKATVLVSGESGTGKEVVAKSIHQQSPRRDKQFVAINCAAIPENLLESELFGHAKGAFTGAIDKKIGLFEEADGGTLFLDEIGDLSGALQAKLLRVLQERKIRRIGENSSRDIDVRVVAATHKNLTVEVSEGRFREDLFFRLNVIPVKISPLRERREDVLPLAEYFLKKFVLANNSPISGFSKAAAAELLRKQWRGNVRELENTVERAVVMCRETLIEPVDLISVSEFELYPVAAPTSSVAAISPGGFIGVAFDATDEDLPTLEDLGVRYAQWVANRVGGIREKARRILDIDRKTLARKLQKFEPNGPEAH